VSSEDQSVTVVVGRFEPLARVDAADLGRIVARHLPVLALGGQELEHEVLIRLKLRHRGSGVKHEPLRGGVLLAARGTSHGAGGIEILTALGHARNGLPKQAVLEPVRVAQVVSGETPLTRRQREVLEHLSRGRSNRQIADALHISTDTVAAHVAKIFRKLGVRKRQQLVGIRVPDGKK
jgi:DNA-binding CsgD family transcriptional regulator